MVCLKSEKNWLSAQTFAILPSARRIGFEKMTVAEILLGQRDPKTILGPGQPRLPHNLRSYFERIISQTENQKIF
jgi:hypothetical protein